MIREALLSFLAVSTYAAAGADMVLVAQIRPTDGLIHEVGADGMPVCCAGTDGHWHLISRRQARALRLMPCSCCVRGDR